MDERKSENDSSSGRDGCMPFKSAASKKQRDE